MRRDPSPLLPRPGYSSGVAPESLRLHRASCIANHRIQMRAGHGCLTLREGNILPNQSCMVQIRIEDALAHCERARQAGAKILTEPKDHIYGERQYDAEDFYGHKWNFTETIADVDPESYGGIAVNIDPRPS